MSIEVVNLTEWINQNSPFFKPPVCNKLMFGAGQLLVMFVGGPNIRQDYHLEEGEELFYMIKGDMCLKVKENGKSKDIIIKEGEMFLLPRKIPHSPQRFENTIGLVIERERRPNETDCLRYYCESDTDTILFERWFHCTDLGTQLAPIIKHFFNSEECKTGRPGKNSIVQDPAFQPDTETTLMQPFSFQKWLESNRDSLNQKKEIMLFSETECQLRIATNCSISGKGSTEEVWLWIYEDHGSQATLTLSGCTKTMSKDEVCLIPAEQPYTLAVGKDTVIISVMLKPA